MATAQTAAAAQAEAHREGQEALASLIWPLLAQAWALLDLDALEATLPRFRAAVQSVVEYYGRASAAAALQHFKAARREAGVQGRVSVPAVADTPDGFLDQLIVETVTQAIEDTTKAADTLDAKAEQLVLDQGRRQLLTAAALDGEAKGWARIPNPDACSFCLMLAIRGAAFKSKRGANFRAHDNCRCSVEPVFGRYEPTAQVREAERVWKDATKGRRGHDARTAFRQAIEGREVTGAPGKSSRSKGRAYADPAGKTPESQRTQLRILEAMPPAKTPEAAEWRANRIAEIRKFLSE